MLEANAIAKSFSNRGECVCILKHASLTLEPGDAAVIMGPSGSGKSTFLNIVGTLEPPTDGTVRIGGVDPFSLSELELARFRNARIGFVFQEHHLLPQCTVLENVLLPTLAFARSAKDPQLADSPVTNRCHTQSPGPQAGVSASTSTSTIDSDLPSRARALLDRVGLSHRLDHRPGELSGGERQRVAIARALINRPAVVLADEPTGNLDHDTAERIAELLVELPPEQNAILIAVTHSDALAARFKQRFDLVDGGLQRKAV